VAFTAGPTYTPASSVGFTWSSNCAGHTTSLYVCTANSGETCSSSESKCSVLSASTTATSATWAATSGLTGYYYGCVEDDKALGSAGLDTQGFQVFDYSTELCFQSLAMTSPAAGTGGRLATSSASTTHAYLMDNITYSFTETCLDAIDFYYCTSTSTATSCGSNADCVHAGSLNAGDSHVDSAASVYTYSFVLQARETATGYQYACVADAANTDAFDYSDMYCVQLLTMASVLGGTNSGTFAHTTSGTNSGETVTLAWAQTCAEEQSVYDCTYSAAGQSPGQGTRCSDYAYCTYIGASSTNSFSIAASSLITGIRYALHPTPHLFLTCT
jgi:hypothetical protein